MRRANNNIPGGAKTIGSFLWPYALARGRSASPSAFPAVNAI